jgi:predicted regulator of Ras-like GTPase activity (Roadblock/LC7/MglB family)
MFGETKTEKLVQTLKDLKQNGGISGAAIVTRDGLLVASELSEDIDGETLAAMTATMTGAAETAMSELKKRGIERVIVESKDARLISTEAGKQTILVCMVDIKAKLGLVLLEMERTAKIIEKEVEK